MEDEVIFEDYNIRFTENDFKHMSIEDLEKCKEKLEIALSKLDKI